MGKGSKKEKIIHLRKNGFSIDEISKQIGCSKSTVSYHVNNENLGGTLGWLKKVKEDVFLKNISEDTICEIRAMRISGDSYNSISKKVSIVDDKLRKICAHLRLNASSKNINATTIDSDVLKRHYFESRSLKKTAYYFGLAVQTVRKIIGEENIIVRKPTVTKSQTVIEWRKRTKIKLVEYKGGKCECCGYNKSTNVLQFHHKNPEEKDFTIGGKSYSFEKLKIEVDKCILVCANCHIEIHEELREKGVSEKIKNIAL